MNTSFFFKYVIFNLEEFSCKFNRFIRLNYFSCDSFQNIKFSKSAESLIYGTPPSLPAKKSLYWPVYFGPRVPKNIYCMPYLITFKMYWNLIADWKGSVFILKYAYCCEKIHKSLNFKESSKYVQKSYLYENVGPHSFIIYPKRKGEIFINLFIFSFSLVLLLYLYFLSCHIRRVNLWLIDFFVYCFSIGGPFHLSFSFILYSISIYSCFWSENGSTSFCI